MPESTHNPAKRALNAMLLTLSLLLSACATTSAPCAPDLPQVPKPPALQQPIPSESYLGNAQKRIEMFRKSLTDMPLMSRP